jgi:hypothetical protein
MDRNGAVFGRDYCRKGLVLFFKEIFQERPLGLTLQILEWGLRNIRTGGMECSIREQPVACYKLHVSLSSLGRGLALLNGETEKLPG